MSNRIRQTITDNPNVGGVRHDAYTLVIQRYQQAFQDGYYIECISLMESIITDRMESLANEISSSRKYSYKTMEKLLDYLKGENQKDFLNDIILQCLDGIGMWKNGRNTAIHEMAKLPDDLTESFQTRYNRLETLAIEGYKLFRELDNGIRKLRNQQKFNNN